MAGSLLSNSNARAWQVRVLADHARLSISIGAVVLLWVLVKLLTPVAGPYVPATESMLLFLAAVAATTQVKVRYARYILVVWLIWFVIGSISLYAYNLGKTKLDYNVDTHLADRFYLLSVLLTALGMAIPRLIGLKWHEAPYRAPADRTHPIVLGLLLLAPVLYLISVVQATGDLPILSGRNLSAQMYEEKYGFFHGYGIVTSVTALVLWMYLLEGQMTFARLSRRIGLGAVIVVVLFVAMVDGRRAFAIFGIVAMLMYYFGSTMSVRRYLWVGILALLGLGSYISTAIVRMGDEAGALGSDTAVLFSTFAMEFRDFTYSFASIDRETVLRKGYDWLGSTFVGFVPSPIAAVLGIDKSAVSQTDSARMLMDFFYTKLGVRIGIQGEIWFAYSWPGLAVFVVLGFVFCWTAHCAAISPNRVPKAIWLVVVSLWALALLGQSTVTFGLILPLVYLAIIVQLVNVATGASRPFRRRRASPGGPEA